MPEILAGSDLNTLIIALAIALSLFVLAGVFYYILRRLAHGAAAKTGTALDNMLLEALEWPVFFALVLAGAYFAIVYLPIEESLDAEIRRGFHVAFVLLAAYSGGALIDAMLRWFKLEITCKTHTALDDYIVAFLRTASPLLLALIAILICLGQYGIETGSISGWLLTHGMRIGIISAVGVAMLLTIDVAGSRAITAIVTRGATAEPEEEVKKRVDTLARVLITAAQIFILTIATFIILTELNIDIAPVLAGAGVVGIAIGFGAQSMVKDMIAGFFVVMENQYRVGDVVKIADISGLVEEINLRRTVLRDLDGVVHVVPNGEVKVASNYTKGLSRVNLDISVSYDTDLDHAIAVINKVCADMTKEPEWCSLIIRTPQTLRVEKLGASGIDLKVTGDTKPMRQWDVTGELRKRIKKAFEQEGIEIPYPHTKVIFGNSPFPQPPAAEKRSGKDGRE